MMTSGQALPEPVRKMVYVNVNVFLSKYRGTKIQLGNKPFTFSFGTNYYFKSTIFKGDKQKRIYYAYWYNDLMDATHIIYQ